MSAAASSARELLEASWLSYRDVSLVGDCITCGPDLRIYVNHQQHHLGLRATFDER